MAITSYPFDGQTVTETQYSQLFRELQDSGVAASADSTALKVTSDSLGMNVDVAAGFAVVRGHAVNSTASESLTIGSADATQTRIDRIVLRLNPTANSITLAVVAGTPGGSAPSLTQTDSGNYELLLADVTVAPGITNLPAAAVTDRRSFVGTRIGTWTTAGRPASPRKSQLGLNSTTSSWEYWNGSAWTDIAPVVTWDNITGKPSTFAPSSHTHPWSEISGAPATYAPSAHSHDWSEISGKPSTFAPSTHYHDDRYSLLGHAHSGVYAAASHGHSGYATSGHTHDYVLNAGDLYGKPDGRVAPYANATGRVHAESVSGSGTYYAVWVNGNGAFNRNTSSRRFKENIKTHEVDPHAVLNLRPVMYDRINGNPNEYGLIAEEVHEHLPELTVWDEEGRIDALRYDLLPIAMLGIIKEQQLRLDALESIIDDMCKCDEPSE